MGTLTETEIQRSEETQQREVRALALQAASRLFSGDASDGSESSDQRSIDRVLCMARTFEQFIETGTWNTDPEAKPRGPQRDASRLHRRS